MASTSLSPLPCLTLSSSSHLHSCLAFGEAGAGARVTRAICSGKQMGGIKISHKYESLKASSVSASASLTLDSFFGESEDEGGEELKEKAKCPPGLRSYEMMLVLRPDISEEDRLVLTQRYEEMIVAGGGIGVEVFNRGLIPLAYSIKKRVALTGELDTFLDGVYLLFTYFAKPETVLALETMIKKDDDVIRSSIFKIRERKY